MSRDQREFWTDQAGPAWVTQQAQMDRLLSPVLDEVLARAGIKTGEAVLDIGCGAGTSSARAAEIVGPDGYVLGADISETLLNVARTQASDVQHLEFALADAATHAFDLARFDHLISRFGVMFFDDSEGAFRNMVAALKPGAKLSFATWGQVPENPYFTFAAKAARTVLGPIPKTDPDAPGPFAFRAPEMVLNLLTNTGFAEAEVEVVSLTLPALGGLEEFVDLCCSIGPAQSALVFHKATPEQAEALKAELKAVYAQFMSEDGVNIPAQINFFTARAQ